MLFDIEPIKSIVRTGIGILSWDSIPCSLDLRMSTWHIQTSIGLPV